MGSSRECYIVKSNIKKSSAVKRCNDRIQNDKFVTRILTSSMNIFDKICIVWGSQQAFNSRIDCEVNIAKLFAMKYVLLYNKVKNGLKLAEIRNKIVNGIDNDVSSVVDRFSNTFIRSKLNTENKND